MSTRPAGVLPDQASAAAGRASVRFVLVFALLGTLFDGAELNLVGYPMAYISDSLHVSTIQLVQVTTWQGFASIFGGILFGWLGDMIGRRWTYTVSVLVFGVAAVLGGLAPNYLVFLVTRLLAGVGMGALFGLTYSMFAECWHTTKRGMMGGSIQAMYYIGQIVTEGVVYFCTVSYGEHEGWRAGYLVVGVVTLIIGLASARLLPESPRWLTYRAELQAGRVPEPLRGTRVPLVDLFRRGYASGTLLFVVLASGVFITTNSMIAYMSTFLIKVEKVPLGTASLIVFLGLVITTLTYPLAGMLSDVIRRKWSFFAASAFGIIGFAWMLGLVTTHSTAVGAQFWTYPTFWALMMCSAAGGGFGVLGVWMAEFFPTRTRSSGSNLSYYAGRGIGAGLFPLAALAIGGSVPMALALGIVGPLAGATFSLFAPDSTGRRIEAVE
jgi:MFS family permease